MGRRSGCSNEAGPSAHMSARQGLAVAGSGRASRTAEPSAADGFAPINAAAGPLTKLSVISGAMRSTASSVDSTISR